MGGTGSHYRVALRRWIPLAVFFLLGGAVGLVGGELWPGAGSAVNAVATFLYPEPESSPASREIAQRAEEHHRAVGARTGAFRLTPEEKDRLVARFYEAAEAKRRFLERMKRLPPKGVRPRTIAFTEPGEYERPLWFQPGVKTRSLAVACSGPTAASFFVRLCRNRATFRPALNPRDVEQLSEFFLLNMETQVVDVVLADKLFRLVKDNHYFGAPPTPEEPRDAEVLLRRLGYGLCDAAAQTLADLAAGAGLAARVVHLGVNRRRGYRGDDSHVVVELRYDDGTDDWHMFDPSKGYFFLKDLGDGYYKIASAEDVKRDPSIITRTLSGHDRTPLGDWSLDQIVNFHAKADIAPEAEIPVSKADGRRDVGRLLDFLSPLDLLNLSQDRPMPGLWSPPVASAPSPEEGCAASEKCLSIRPAYLKGRLEPGDRVELTNMPLGTPLPRNPDDPMPEFYANGRLYHGLPASRTIEAGYPIAAIAVQPAAAAGSVQVSFDDGCTWLDVSDTAAVRRRLAEEPRYKYEAKPLRPLDEDVRVVTTFSVSPFILGQSDDRDLSLYLRLASEGEDPPVELKVEILAERL